MKYRYLIFTFMLMSNLSYSSGYITPLGTGVKINKVQILGSGGMVIWLKQNIPNNPDNCSEESKVYVRPDLTQYNAMVSVVLAAHAQEKEVGFWTSGCGTNYFYGPPTFPVIRDLWIN